MTAETSDCNADLPDPLTPADCDLRSYEWMPVDTGRLLKSETWILGTAEEKVAAFTLWSESWHQIPAGSLPDNDRMLAHLSGTGARWPKIRDHAMRGWVLCADGRYYHPVVCDKAREAWAIKAAQRARTEAARAARSSHRRPAPRATDAATISATQTVTSDVADPVTVSVTEDVTETTGQDSTRQDIRAELRSGADAPLQPEIEIIAPVQTKPLKPMSARDRLWSEGLPIVQALTGKPLGGCRTLLGRWLRTSRDDCARLLRLLREAEDFRPVDPVSWIEAALASRLTRQSNAERIAAELGLDEPDASDDWRESSGVLRFPADRRIA